MDTWWIIKDSRFYAPSHHPVLSFRGPFETYEAASRAYHGFPDKEGMRIINMQVPPPQPEPDSLDLSLKFIEQDRRIEELQTENRALQQTIGEKARRIMELIRDVDDQASKVVQLENEIVSLRQIIARQDRDRGEAVAELELLLNRLQHGEIDWDNSTVHEGRGEVST